MSEKISNFTPNHDSLLSQVLAVYCSKCGAANADDARFCAGCGTGLTPTIAAGPVVVYAGFWRRYVALIIDGVIATPVMLILLLPFGVTGALTAVIGKAAE